MFGTGAVSGAKKHAVNVQAVCARACDDGGQASPCVRACGDGVQASLYGAAAAEKPARLLHDADVIYCYDGSFEGFLCCVFESFARHELPFAVWPPERMETSLCELRTISTDPALAHRVYRSFGPKLGAKAREMILVDFLSYYEDKELLLLRFLHLAYARGPQAAAMLGHPDVAPLYAMHRHIMREAEKLMGFVRFEESDGMLGAVIHPKNHILPMLRAHFCARFPQEEFLIYDAAHCEVLLHTGGKAELRMLEAPLTLPPPSEKELFCQQLWKQYYKTMEIKPRHNERCRRTMCPKRYWADMTELRGEL